MLVLEIEQKIFNYRTMTASIENWGDPVFFSGGSLWLGSLQASGGEHEGPGHLASPEG
jgi:hypothetical protein